MRAWLVILALIAVTLGCSSETPILCDAAGCNDANPCTDDKCVPAKGCQHTALASGTCQDGDPCTTGDSCVAGACKGANSLDCNDNSPCTQDSCAVGLGCQHTATTGPCDDGSACTLNDTCYKGSCKAFDTLACDDGNACTIDGCDFASGCVHQPAGPVPCSDGDACSLNDLCKDGQCLGKVLNCDDNNPCTSDDCDKNLACTHLATPQAKCDDGDACTQSDGCNSGWCKGSPLNCADDNPCTSDGCNPVSGCQYDPGPSGGPCLDSNACAQDKHCSSGSCQGAPVLCGDGNPCTADSCDPVKGCVFTLKSGPCSDGNACTTGDVCKEGVCGGIGGIDCNDWNPCTSDMCLAEAGCVHQILAGLPCDDGSACTLGDACQADTAACVGGKTIACFDGNECTQDTCDAKLGCQFPPTGGFCDDDDPCTTWDLCKAGKCAPGKPFDCSDGNPCTDDACDSGVKCVHSANAAPCDDGDACTSGDGCDAKACKGQPSNLCNDNNPCTTDSCSSATGMCSHAVLTGLVCDDGNPCSAADACDKTGVCKGTGDPCNDSNACTSDACDPIQAGKCLHTAVSCDDGLPCTTDSCNPLSGCTHSPSVGAACSDGNVCTSGDACVSATSCQGKLIACNDNNPCTHDTCFKITGCAYEPNQLACDDGNPCTTGDICAAGSCSPGKTPLNCSDGNNCTLESCDPLKGCQHGPAPEWTSCDASNANMICSATGYCLHALLAKQSTYIASAKAEFGCDPASLGLMCPDSARPIHVATLDPFFIDVTEARVSDYTKCVAAGSCPAITDPACNSSMAGKSDHPVNCLNRDAATKYCKFIGKRLPTEHEWERAARGPTCTVSTGGVCLAGNQLYPWGIGPATCALAIFNDSGVGCGTGGTWSVGAGWHAPWGPIGMAGNVSEWVSDDFLPTYNDVAAVNPKGPKPNGTGILRGRSAWGIVGVMAVFFRADSPQGASDPSFGVRCAHDFVPQP